MLKGARKAVFFDRDGVINKVVLKDGIVRTPRRFAEFELKPGVAGAMDSFKVMGFSNIVVTNQPDVSRGLMSAEDMEMMHAHMKEHLPIDEVFVCTHDDADNCECRKPGPGMLVTAIRKWGLDPSVSFVIGDTWKDAEAGRKAGCRTILLDMPYNQGVESDYRIRALEDAVEIAACAADARVASAATMVEPETGAYVKTYLEELHRIAEGLDTAALERMIDELVDLRRRDGRLFFLGVGGGAGNAAHAVNDFRKIAGIESYAPTDNVSELSARTNDDGWDTVFLNWLRGSRLKSNDALFVFSVGGGSDEKKISANLVHALRYAKDVKARIFGIVGRDGGYTARVADAFVIVPTVNAETVTPHTESFQAVLWHMMVTHPRMKAYEMKWESSK
jgi:D-sedoheptulose 7-phosphate isomerase